jgi:anti-sigma regulatory factor (Ser/Thr protein kinase)
MPASTEAPGRAQRLVATVGQLAAYPDLRFAARLLVSELVSNSVRHTGLGADPSISLSLQCDEETLRVEVADAGPGLDALTVLARHRRNEELFHGIFLVNALADRWGFRRGDTGCVWFEIDLVPGRRPWRGRQTVPHSHPAH